MGAGPAGSSAAHAAASAGARTLVLDASDFPRYKTCGGGLIGVSSRLLADVPRLPVRAEITEVAFSKHGGRPVVRCSAEPSMRMVHRSELDDALLKRATGAGATFVPGARLAELTPNGDEVELRTTAGDFRARAVVGADGSASRSAQHVGVEYAVTDLGLEVELEAGELADSWRHRVHLDWGRLPGSYAWVFPKGDVLTAGVIAERGRPRETRDYLRSFLEGLGLDNLPVVRDSGHLTRCRSVSSPLAKGRVLVAGDAAGLLEPWTREGISFALRSGRLAGAHAATFDTSGYGAAVLAELGDEMRAGAAARAAFERHPGAFHLALSRSSVGWRSFQRIMSGETTLARAHRHHSVATALRLLGRAV